MDVAEVHEWLQKHRLFGNQLEGFWRVDPTAPPVSQDEMRALMNAALRLDTETLEEIIRQERAGWNRPQIVEEAEQALSRRVRSMRRRRPLSVSRSRRRRRRSRARSRRRPRRTDG
jgi:hypothetical protein